MARQRSYYDVLNVAPDAETVVIEAAYRALMKKYHPDQGPAAAGGASATEINEAFALLRDPERRADYDHREWARQQSVRLAAYPPLRPPPRRSAFGWSGWIVALVLGGVVAVMASRADGVAAPDALEAGLAAPDFRSQPSPADSPAVTAAVARVRDEALKPPRAALETEVAAAADTAPAAVEPPPAPRLAREPSAAQPRRARARPRVRAKALPADDRDFLEREGYIY